MITMTVNGDDPALAMSIEPQNGTMDHNKLLNRDMADQHPMTSIDGLTDELAKKLEAETDPTVPAWAKQPTKPSYTPAEVGAQPAGDYALSSDIRTKTSELENDSGFLTSIPSEYVTAPEMQDYAQPKPTIESVTVNTPAYTNNPTIAEALNAAFVVGETYFVNLGTGGEFTLMTRFNNTGTAVAQTFTLSGYDTGNSGVLAQNKAVQFLSIAGDRLSFVMRAAGVSSVSFTSRPVKCKLTFSGMAVPLAASNLYTRISLGNIIEYSNVFTTNTRTTYKNKIYIFPVMAMPNQYNMVSGSIEYEMRGKYCYGEATQYLNSNKFYPPSSTSGDSSIYTSPKYSFVGMSVNGLDMVSNITEFLFSSDNWVMLNGTEVKLEVYA